MVEGREVLKIYEAFRDLIWANSENWEHKEIYKSVGRIENNEKPLQAMCVMATLTKQRTQCKSSFIISG